MFFSPNRPSAQLSAPRCYNELRAQASSYYGRLMVDIYSRTKRSDVMRAVRSKNTKPEIFIRKLLRKSSLVFKTYSSSLPGRPDIVFPKKRKVIFVHGCFWHQHRNCSASVRPTSNTLFWNPKLDRNVVRDQLTRKKLAKLGWKSLVVWECGIKKPTSLVARIRKFVQT